MIYFELKISIQLKEDVIYEKSYQALSKFISHVMLQDESLKEYHQEKFVKGYVFTSLFPIEKDKIYKSGRVYIMHLRSLNLEFILKLKKYMERSHDTVIKVLAIQMSNYLLKPIIQLKSLTPIVCTLDSGRYWTKEDGIKLLMERINTCAIKKYKRYIGELEEEGEGFIESIELLNYKPIKIPYKSTSLIGNKIIISCKSDEYSQKLAFTILASGLEKGSVGMGYFIMDRG
ncbi:MAG: associated protein Cas6 [Clostridiales bacterium]|jgi:CRISPR-associated endoribonuclease Cas6|nr:associated protein Cas6 [Clostridiales bacterium]